MVQAHPFRAWRPKSSDASRVASVPYDVVNRAEAAKLAQDNPASFLHVTKPEIDLDASIDAYSDIVYAQGAQAFQSFVTEGLLVQDPTAGFYLYELVMGPHTQTGVVLCVSVEEYDQNIVRRHEFTRPDKENDRVRHMEAIGAQTGTVFLVHRDSDAIARVIASVKKSSPEVDFIADDSVRHRLWPVFSPTHIAQLQAGFGQLNAIYIADGHHRSAAASRVAAARRAAADQQTAEQTIANPRVPENDEVEFAASQRFVAVSFPASEVQILPYNRLVRDLNGLTLPEFLAAVEKSFEIHPAELHAVTVPGTFRMYCDRTWRAVRPRAPVDQTDPTARLDVSVLQDRLLAPILGIKDPRRDHRIDFVGGIRGELELERRVNSGECAVAFSLHPTAIKDLFMIADANQVMPPKSTWFEPKLRDGLVIHAIAPQSSQA